MSNRQKSLLFFILDMLILFGCMTCIFYLRPAGKISLKYLYQHYQLYLYVFPFWALVYFIEGIYTLKTYNPADLPISIIRGTILSVMISIAVLYVLPFELESITPKTNLVLIAILAVPILYLTKKQLFGFFSHTSRLRGTLLIGSKATLKIVEEEIMRKPHLGYKIVGSHTSEISKLPITPGVQLIAVERSVTKDHGLFSEIFNLLGSSIEIIDLAKFAERISGKIPLQAINESWFIDYCGHQESRSYDVVKNIFDRTIAAILFVILIPFAVLILPLLLILHGRPIFFKQSRTGLNNRPFTLYKLRTMVLDAEKGGAQWARPGDARITALGKILRKTRIDELPQLINILKGEMSLVGPRPERPEIISRDLAPSIPYYHLRHLVKPGVTGWAQVTFRYGFSTEDSLEKLQYDLFYVKNRSGWLDLLVILKTVKTVITGAGQ